MSFEKYGKRLVGNKEERAVSPVIGVILMVAITVILAAVIAAFVLDLGSSVGQEAQAGVTMEVDESSAEDELSIQVTSLGNSDYVTFGGIASDIEEDDTETSNELFNDADGGEEGTRTSLDDHQMVTGDAVTITKDNIDTDVEGTVTAIAVIEEDDTRTQVGSVEIAIDGS